MKEFEAVETSSEFKPLSLLSLHMGTMMLRWAVGYFDRSMTNLGSQYSNAHCGKSSESSGNEI